MSVSVTLVLFTLSRLSKSSTKESMILIRALFEIGRRSVGYNIMVGNYVGQLTNTKGADHGLT